MLPGHRGKGRCPDCSWWARPREVGGEKQEGKKNWGVVGWQSRSLENSRGDCCWCWCSLQSQYSVTMTSPPLWWGRARTASRRTPWGWRVSCGPAWWGEGGRCQCWSHCWSPVCWSSCLLGGGRTWPRLTTTWTRLTLNTHLTTQLRPHTILNHRTPLVQPGGSRWPQPMAAVAKPCWWSNHRKLYNCSFSNPLVRL